MGKIKNMVFDDQVASLLKGCKQLTGFSETRLVNMVLEAYLLPVVNNMLTAAGKTPITVEMMNAAQGFTPVINNGIAVNPVVHNLISNFPIAPTIGQPTLQPVSEFKLPERPPTQREQADARRAAKAEQKRKDDEWEFERQRKGYEAQLKSWENKALRCIEACIRNFPFWTEDKPPQSHGAMWKQVDWTDLPLEWIGDEVAQEDKIFLEKWTPELKIPVSVLTQNFNDSDLQDDDYYRALNAHPELAQHFWFNRELELDRKTTHPLAPIKVWLRYEEPSDDHGVGRVAIVSQTQVIVNNGE